MTNIPELLCPIFFYEIEQLSLVFPGAAGAAKENHIQIIKANLLKREFDEMSETRQKNIALHIQN